MQSDVHMKYLWYIVGVSITGPCYVVWHYSFSSCSCWGSIRIVANQHCQLLAIGLEESPQKMMISCQSWHFSTYHDNKHNWEKSSDIEIVRKWGGGLYHQLYVSSDLTWITYTCIPILIAAIYFWFNLCRYFLIYF